MNYTYYPANHTFSLTVKSKSASDLGWYKLNFIITLENYDGKTVDGGYLVLNLVSSTPCAFATIMPLEIQD